MHIVVGKKEKQWQPGFLLLVSYVYSTWTNWLQPFAAVVLYPATMLSMGLDMTQGTSQVFLFSTGFPFKVFSLCTEPEEPWYDWWCKAAC
jgi:hypothetical protein